MGQSGSFLNTTECQEHKMYYCQTPIFLKHKKLIPPLMHFRYLDQDLEWNAFNFFPTALGLCKIQAAIVLVRQAEERTTKTQVSVD